jgi:hypothetical protein
LPKPWPTSTKPAAGNLCGVPLKLCYSVGLR